MYSKSNRKIYNTRLIPCGASKGLRALLSGITLPVSTSAEKAPTILALPLLDDQIYLLSYCATEIVYLCCFTDVISFCLLS